MATDSTPTDGTGAQPGRRVEGLILQGDDFAQSKEVAEAVGRAVAVGVHVAVLASVPLESFAVPRYPHRSSTLLLLIGAGMEAAVLDEAGGRHRPARGSVGMTVDSDPWSMAVTELGRHGVDVRGVLGVTAASGLGRGSICAGVATAVEVLHDQRARRERGELPVVDPPADWSLRVEGFDPPRERARSAWLTSSDGKVGWCGAPSMSHPDLRHVVLCAGVYDGEGPAEHLLVGPVPSPSSDEPQPGAELRRVLDLRTGVLAEQWDGPGGGLSAVRFASLAAPGTLVRRALWPAGSRPERSLAAPDDGVPTSSGRDDDAAWMQVGGTGRGSITAAAVNEASEGATRAVDDQFTAYVGHPWSTPGPELAAESAHRARQTGFDHLLNEHRERWARRWSEADVVVEGDDALQLALRFSLFHLMASVADDGEAAVGARGLTGTSYRGHVFWDADTFTMPFLAATHPPAARAMLEYRLRRLPAAREAARALGLEGVRFPWECAREGRDVTPPSARDRTGRLVPIRTGLLEEHIVADVAWAARCYADWTGDEDFVHGPGLPLFVESARYWASRARVLADGSAHLYGVIGPDEYHEPVDDNAFTNVMARWNLREAAALVDTVGPEAGVPAAERAHWLDLADVLVDGYDPDTGIYEQFAGFHRLEPLIVDTFAPRRPIAADLLLGAERVRQAQVIKQADVLMLHHLVPDEVVADTLEANLGFYEPRTAHGSSLSPAIHAALFARAGNLARAVDALRIASRIDLDDLTGTTAGGLHLATMGGLWQAMVFGFAGVRPMPGALSVDPVLPSRWTALEVKLQYLGTPVTVRVMRTEMVVRADEPRNVVVGGSTHRVGRTGANFARARAGSWEVST